jgi:cob(I)alamin adenosyltransferase
MIRYSHKVLLKKNQTQLLGLQHDLALYGRNEKIEQLIEEKKKQIEWIEKEIEEGKDPGVHIL